MHQPAWPSVEQQLAQVNVVPGSALEKLIRDNQDFHLLRPQEANMSTTSVKGITGDSRVPGPFGDVYGVWSDSDFSPDVLGSSNENSVSSTDRADLSREGAYHA